MFSLSQSNTYINIVRNQPYIYIYIYIYIHYLLPHMTTARTLERIVLLVVVVVVVVGEGLPACTDLSILTIGC